MLVNKIGHYSIRKIILKC